jgi:hypothetical protein
MSTTMTIEVPVFFQPVGRSGRKALRPREDKPALPPGRVPRVARRAAGSGRPPKRHETPTHAGPLRATAIPSPPRQFAARQTCRAGS